MLGDFEAGHVTHRDATQWYSRLLLGVEWPGLLEGAHIKEPVVVLHNHTAVQVGGCGYAELGMCVAPADVTPHCACIMYCICNNMWGIQGEFVDKSDRWNTTAPLEWSSSSTPESQTTQLQLLLPPAY